MDTSCHKDCYGDLFPDVLHASTGRPMKGKVFACTIHAPAGIHRAWREIGVDMRAWDECRQCPEFDDCYKLSMAKLSLADAIDNF